MSGDEGALDFTLRWKDSDAPRASEHDSVHVGEKATEEGNAVEADASRVREDDFDGHDGPPSEQTVSEGQDDFQWSAERQAQLEEAFDAIPADAPARVHLQLHDISQALQNGSLGKERALVLIGEVEDYLSARIHAEQRKSQVDHELFMRYRADKLNALYAWQETATALREFCTGGEEVQLRVAHYAAQQASDFLHNAWDLLQSAEPTPEEASFEEEDEPENDDQPENDDEPAGS